jgi:hypothetical protein
MPHEQGKGADAALELTMGSVKGEIVRHTPGDLPAIIKVVGTMERQPPEKIFKEAHLLVKRLVVELGGKQGTDTLWTLSSVAIQTIPEHYLNQLGQALLRLCIAYDNLSAQQKKELTTASEIIKNKSWLVALAVRCVEAGTLHTPASSSVSASASAASSTGASAAASSRRTGATPPSGSKLLGHSKQLGASPPARSGNTSSSKHVATVSSLPHHRTPPFSSGAAARGRSPPFGRATAAAAAAAATIPSPSSGFKRRTPPPPVRLSPPASAASASSLSLSLSPRGTTPPGSPPFLAGKAKAKPKAGTPSPLGLGGGTARSGIKPPSSPARGFGKK